MIVRFACAGVAAVMIALAPPATPAYAGSSGAAGEFSWVRQRAPAECGRAALASLAAHRGRNGEATYDRLPPPSDPAQGYSLSEMIRYAPVAGIRLTPTSPTGRSNSDDCALRPNIVEYLTRLQRLIQQSRPVVVPVARRSTGHYLILYAVDGENFRALDPASGHRLLSRTQLALQMCGYAFVAFETR